MIKDKTNKTMEKNKNTGAKLALNMAVGGNLCIIYNILLSKRTLAIDVNIHKILSAGICIRCDTFMSAIPRRSNS